MIHGTLPPTSCGLAGQPTLVIDNSNAPPTSLHRRSVRYWLSGALSVAVLVTPAQMAPVPAMAAPEDGGLTCTFTLTAPEISVLPGGVRAVTATLKAAACEGNAAPAAVTVCVNAPQGKSVCGEGRAWTAARAVLPSAAPSGTYTASGVGCWDEPTTIVNRCTSSGPIASTL